MTGRIEARLRELNIVLPEPPLPLARYLPYRRSGNTLYVAGMVPVEGKTLPYRGKVGIDLDLAAGQSAARLCALNIMALVKHACAGDLDRVTACLRLAGYVNAGPDFTDHPQIINAATDVIVDVFGEAGAHARMALGANSLPMNVAVEIETVWEVR